MSTTWPRLRTISGNAAFTVFHTPIRFTSSTRSAASPDIAFTVAALEAMPALATATSRRPWRSTVAATAERSAPGSVTSQASPSPPGPAARRRPRAAPWSRSTTTTVGPARASSWAVAKPMPRAAPVTSATLPATGKLAIAASLSAREPVRHAGVGGQRVEVAGVAYAGGRLGHRGGPTQASEPPTLTRWAPAATMSSIVNPGPSQHVHGAPDRGLTAAMPPCRPVPGA